METKEEKGRGTIELLKDHLGLITAISSTIGLAITGIFKCASYWYTKAYYDFWEIPIKYMNIDYFKILMQFLYILSVTIFIIAFGIIYIKIYNSMKLKGRIILHIVPLFINLIFSIITLCNMGCKLLDTFVFWTEHKWIVYVEMQVVLYPFECMLIHIFKSNVKEKKSQVENNDDQENVENGEKNISDEKRQELINREQKQKKKMLLLIELCSLYLILAIFAVCSLAYNSKKTKCEDTYKFEIISEISGIQYIILDTYNEKYLVKECHVYEKDHYIDINTDKFKFIELGETEVEIYNFKDYVNSQSYVFKKLNNNDFNVIKMN